MGSETDKFFAVQFPGVEPSSLRRLSNALKKLGRKSGTLHARVVRGVVKWTGLEDSSNQVSGESHKQ